MFSDKTATYLKSSKNFTNFANLQSNVGMPAKLNLMLGCLQNGILSAFRQKGSMEWNWGYCEKTDSKNLKRPNKYQFQTAS